MFPQGATSVENFSLVATSQRNLVLWHLRYGHLNIKGLKMLSQKGMGRGLPYINPIEICEGCGLGNQTLRSFPIGLDRTTLSPLELVHADVCGFM